jgi:hypothetical protein
MSIRARAFRWTPVGAILLAFGLAGCFNPFDPRISSQSGISEPAPIPNTASNILNLFAWCWNHRAIDEYSEVFTDDFEFQFAATDSAGNAFTGRALFRQEELDTARHLFVEGTATEPPASSINLILDKTFVAFPDSRPGKAYPWHQEIRTQVTLSIDAGEQQYRILGHARFFVTRGDSAKIPQELINRGFRPDINRWYIERWEDETVEGPGGAALAPGDASRLLHSAMVAAMSRGTALRPAGMSGTSDALPVPLDVSWGWIQYVYAR